MEVWILFLLSVFGSCVLTAECTRGNSDHETKKPAHRLVRPLVFNPKNEWDNFVRQAERNDKRDKKLREKMLQKVRTLQVGKLRGPKGPRGPQGPPGAVISRREFRKLMKEFVENQIQIRVFDGFTECATRSCNGTTEYGHPKKSLFAIGQVRIVPKVVRSFTWNLSRNITVEPKKMEELSNFQKSTVIGSHTRCIEINRGIELANNCNNETIENGRYIINRTGVYTFYVILHFLKDVSCTRGHSDRVSTVLCIDSLCDENMSLRTTSSLQETLFTETVAGFLYLKKGQYISVYVDNVSNCLLNVSDKSYVSGILSGV